MNVNEFESKYKKTAELIESYSTRYAKFNDISLPEAESLCNVFLTECDEYVVNDIVCDNHLDICDLISTYGCIKGDVEIKNINRSIVRSVYSIYYNDFDEYFCACNIYKSESDELNRRIIAYKESKLAA